MPSGCLAIFSALLSTPKVASVILKSSAPICTQDSISTIPNTEVTPCRLNSRTHPSFTLSGFPYTTQRLDNANSCSAGDPQEDLPLLFLKSCCHTSFLQPVLMLKATSTQGILCSYTAPLYATVCLASQACPCNAALQEAASGMTFFISTQ